MKNTVKEMANGNTKLERLLVLAIEEAVMTELVEYDALDKYNHLEQQLLNNEALTQAERKPSNIDYSTYEGATLAQDKAEHFTNVILNHMNKEQFEQMILDIETLEFNAEQMLF